jgi:hypothetical protein
MKVVSTTTDTTDIILVYPFVGGIRIEDAAKHLKVSSHDEKMLSEQEILKLQQEATLGRSHILTITAQDRDILNKPQFLNDTLVDFWMRWYGCNCCSCRIIFSAFDKADGRLSCRFIISSQGSLGRKTRQSLAFIFFQLTFIVLCGMKDALLYLAGQLRKA